MVSGSILAGGTSVRAADATGSSTTAATPIMEADNGNNNERDMHGHQNGLYRSNELSFDVFGAGSLGEYTIKHLSTSRIRNNSGAGAGVGLNYFITRNLGIGADASSRKRAPGRTRGSQPGRPSSRVSITTSTPMASTP